jgi:uncharacterized protein
MKILITGATGLIGQAFIKHYAHLHTFHVVSRSADKVNHAFHHEIQQGVLEKVDLTLLNDLNAYDAVINLAGEAIVDKRWSDKQKQHICHSRWDITERIVALIQASSEPPEVFLSGSAIGIYGRQADTSQPIQPIDEQFSDYNEEFAREICQRWESIALQAQSELTRVCLLRTGIVLSPTGGALGKMKVPFSLGLGGPVSSGQQIMSWIHIDDMIQAMAHLLVSPTLQGPINFTAPNPVSNAVFSKAYANSLHRPCLFTVPKLALKILMGESADLLLTGQHVVPKALLEHGYVFSHDEIDEALMSLRE